MRKKKNNWKMREREGMRKWERGVTLERLINGKGERESERGGVIDVDR